MTEPKTERLEPPSIVDQLGATAISAALTIGLAVAAGRTSGVWQAAAALAAMLCLVGFFASFLELLKAVVAKKPRAPSSEA